MNRLTLDEMINQEGYFDGWDDKEQFMVFRSEMLKAYEMLSEDEQEYVDDSMIMEHIAMPGNVSVQRAIRSEMRRFQRQNIEVYWTYTD